MGGRRYTLRGAVSGERRRRRRGGRRDRRERCSVGSGGRRGQHRGRGKGRASFHDVGADPGPRGKSGGRVDAGG